MAERRLYLDHKGPRGAGAPWAVHDDGEVFAAAVCSVEGAGGGVAAPDVAARAAELFVERMRAEGLGESGFRDLYEGMDEAMGTGPGELHAVLALLRNDRLDLSFRGACGGMLVRDGKPVAKTWEMREPDFRGLARDELELRLRRGPAHVTVTDAAGRATRFRARISNMGDEVTAGTRAASFRAPNRPGTPAPAPKPPQPPRLLPVVQTRPGDLLVLYGRSAAEALLRQGAPRFPLSLTARRMVSMLSARAAQGDSEAERCILAVDIGEVE